MWMWSLQPTNSVSLSVKLLQAGLPICSWDPLTSCFRRNHHLWIVSTPGGNAFEIIHITSGVPLESWKTSARSTDASWHMGWVAVGLGVSYITHQMGTVVVFVCLLSLHTSQQWMCRTTQTLQAWCSCADCYWKGERQRELSSGSGNKCNNNSPLSDIITSPLKLLFTFFFFLLCPPRPSSTFVLFIPCIDFH